MTTLYNLRHSGDPFNFIITKFVDGEVESSYELAANLRECACPAGHRPSCRHRQMAPMMLASGIIDTHYFWDYDLNRAVDFNGTLKSNFDAMEELAQGRDRTASEIENTPLPALKDPMTEYIVDRIHAQVVAEGPPSEVDQLPPGDYTAEVGEIKAFDDGVVMMQMKNIKPWRRL